MYRALSPHYYKNFESGNMLLYNDCLWLGERLRQLDAELSDVTGRRHPWADEKTKFNAGIKQLETFGNAAYKREMEFQRSALRDILGHAQSFENCSIEPYASRCEEAVNELVNRITSLHKQWKGVLSHSALLQSLGSLLSTVVSAIILEIEDMSDISEVESQQLARFCNHVAKLEDLFRPDDDGRERPAAVAAAGSASTSDQEPPVALTPIYTPNWFRFQFLVSILESSLADIRYLWEEGELRLEFSADEVVDLIQALFADSDLRRRTIADIRRSSGG
jgi:centromere/kinetochore protein ZW10